MVRQHEVLNEGTTQVRKHRKELTASIEDRTIATGEIAALEIELKVRDDKLELMRRDKTTCRTRISELETQVNELKAYKSLDDSRNVIQPVSTNMAKDSVSGGKQPE